MRHITGPGREFSLSNPFGVDFDSDVYGLEIGIRLGEFEPFSK